MKIGQIETKNQYGLKRKEIRYQYAEQGSLHSGKQNTLQNKSILSKPLQEGANAQISFKGFSFNALNSGISLKPIVKIVPKNLQEKVFDSLKKINKQQLKYYTSIKDDYIKYILEHEDFQKQNHLNAEVIEKLQQGQLIYLPKKPIIAKFFTQLVSPLTALYNWGEKLILPKDSPILKRRMEREKVLKNFRALEGLLKSHEIWENGYRKKSGHTKFSESSKFLIPDDVLEGKINRRRNKVVDPNKGKYSSNSLMIGNRLISGIVYSYFLGTDAYNTTMRYSNDPTEAANQRKSRVAQEFSRIGMNMYIQNLLFGTFETAVNRSLLTAMFVSGSTVAFSEILGRKLVGKPIMPSDKDTLDRLEREMYEKKGILPSIGRLLTTVKKKEPSAAIQTKSAQVTFNKTKANDKLFKAFAQTSPLTRQNASQPLKANAQPSFKGYYKVEKLFDKNKLAQIIKILEQTDEQTASTIKKAILKSVKKSELYKIDNALPPKEFNDIINDNAYSKISVGSKDTVWGKWTKSILVPVNFVKNLTKRTYIFLRNCYNIICGKKNTYWQDKLNDVLTNGSKDKKAFEDFLAQRMKLEVWNTSPLPEADKKLEIFKEFVSSKSKEKEDIEGAKNILLWLDKQIKRENIKIKPDGTLDAADVKKVQNLLKESVMRADGEKQLEYDGNTLAQTNINLSRAITTLFLVTDAYNLTMQYSNDNRKDANKSAKNRAAQEISRISVSAYIMAFVHNLLSKLCNSSLAGAFTLTALTSSINDSISRQVVGVPLSAKTQEELEEIDRKNQKSKSPIKKALAYSIGKKSAMPQQAAPAQSAKNDIDYFSNDFFITPEIN